MASGTFLPPDPRVDEPYRLTPQAALRVAILGGIVLLVFGALFLRLWALEILSGHQYLRVARNNQLRTVRLEAPRGADPRPQRPPARRQPRRHRGRAVAHRPAAQVVPAAARAAASVAHRARARQGDAEGDRGAQGRPADARDRQGADQPARSTRTSSERRERVPGPGDAGCVRSALPARLARRAAARLRHRGLAAGAEAPADRASMPATRSARSGIEGAFDAYLRGEPGIQRLRVDSLGRPRGQLKTTLQYRPGAAVRTTLDLRLQQAAERALAYGIQRARDSNCYGCWDANGGAIVALDPHDGSVLALASAPTYQPRRLRRARHDQGAREAGADTGDRRARRTIPRSTARSSPAIRPGRRSSRSPRSPRCSSISSRRTTPLAMHRLVHVAARPCAPGLQELGPVRQPVDRPADGARALVRHVLLPTRRRVLRAAAERRPPAAGVGERASASAGRPGIDVGPEYGGLLPTPEWRQKHFKIGARQALEAGRLDPARDRPEGPARHADADGALLRAHRERRQARDAAPAPRRPAVGRREAPRRTRRRPRAQQINIDPGCIDVVRHGLLEATHSSFGTSTAVFGSFPVADRGQDRHRGEGRRSRATASRGCSTSPGGAATGRTTSRRIVVCAVIENGGHGGAVAAPAALKVFEQFFHEKAAAIGPIHSD